MSSSAAVRFVLLSLGVAFGAACGGDSPTQPGDPSAVVTTVDVTPGATTVVVGDTTPLTATVRDQRGAVLSGHTVSWSSANSAIATVLSDGRVVGIAVGSVQITATVDGKSGSSAVTVSAPSVASVDVGPANPQVFIGDTLVLTATVRDSRGRALSDRTVTWNSATPALATVNDTGLVVGIAAGTATITASSEGRHTSVSVAVTDPGPRMVLQTSAAVTSTIGSSGGVLNAVASNGTEYRLEIPEGALLTPVTITMTPVSNIRKLGLSGGLGGAVHFEPSGLSFARLATLRVKTSIGVPTGMRAAAFTASNDFAERALTPIALQNGEWVLPVAHFSVGGIGFGTTADLTQFTLVAAASMTSLAGQLAAFAVPWDAAARAQAVTLLQQLYTQYVRPGLNDAADDFALITALGNYEYWRFLLGYLAGNGDAPIVPLGNNFAITVPTEFTQANDEARSLAAAAFQLAVTGNAQRCGAEANYNALRNIYTWHGHAADVGVATFAFGLDLPAVQAKLEQFCARVVLLASNLPASLDPGAQFDLELRFGLEFNNGTRTPSDTRVTLSDPIGVAIQQPQGQTGLGTSQDPVGTYRTVITRTAAVVPHLVAEGCLVVTNRVPPNPDPSPRFTSVCAEFCVIGGTGPVGNSAQRSSNVRGARRATFAQNNEMCEPPPPPLQMRAFGFGHLGTHRRLPNMEVCSRELDQPEFGGPLSGGLANNCMLQFQQTDDRGTFSYSGNANQNFTFNASSASQGATISMQGSSTVSTSTSDPDKLPRVKAFSQQDRRVCFIVPFGKTAHYQVSGQIAGTGPLTGAGSGQASVTVEQLGGSTDFLAFVGFSVAGQELFNGSGTLDSGEWCIRAGANVDAGSVFGSASASFSVNATVTILP